MAFWDGSTWAPEPHSASPQRRSSIVGRIKPAALMAMVALTLATGTVFAGGGASKGPWISVSSGDGARLTSATVDSHFLATGCGFRAGSSTYYLVIHGPAPDTASLAYWVDSFQVGSNGCGSATPSWTS